MRILKLTYTSNIGIMIATPFSGPASTHHDPSLHYIFLLPLPPSSFPVSMPLLYCFRQNRHQFRSVLTQPSPAAPRNLSVQIARHPWSAPNQTPHSLMIFVGSHCNIPNTIVTHTSPRHQQPLLQQQRYQTPNNHKPTGRTQPRCEENQRNTLQTPESLSAILKKDEKRMHACSC